jgi:hypothetical protein
MPSHPLARLASCFATGALAAAVVLIDRHQSVPLAFWLKVAWLWLGGNGAAALGFALHIIPASETRRKDKR